MGKPAGGLDGYSLAFLVNLVFIFFLQDLPAEMVLSPTLAGWLAG